MLTALEVRSIVRIFRREPKFSAAVLGSLALGVAVTVSAFSVLDALLSRAPAAIHEPALLARIYAVPRHREGAPTAALAYPTFRQLRAAAHRSEIAAYWRTSAELRGEFEDRPVVVELVSENFFRVLGVRPSLGNLQHGLVPSDQPLGAVISHALWRDAFGGDSAAVGRYVRTSAGSFRVTGVTDDGFRGLDGAPVDLWLPLDAAATVCFGRDALTNGQHSWLALVARIHSASDRSAAGSEVAATFEQTDQGQRMHATLQMSRIEEGRTPGMADVTARSLWLLAASGILLMLCCANVASMLVVRALQRAHETAIRVALGASRLRVLTFVAAQASVLAVAGGIVGFSIAAVARKKLTEVLLVTSGIAAPSSVWRVVLAAGIVTLSAILTVCVVVALFELRREPFRPLRAEVRGLEPRFQRFQGVLAAGQTSLGLILTFGALLFLQSLRKVQYARLGFDYQRIVAVNLDYRGASPGRALHDAAYTEGMVAVRKLAEVEGSAVAVGSPFGWSFGAYLSVPGRDPLAGLEPYELLVSPDYFRVMGTEIVRGRALSEADRLGAPRVAVISETLARAIWEGEEAIGKCVIVNDERGCTEVVGIAADAHRRSVVETPASLLYRPIAQGRGGITSLLVRVRSANAVTLMSIRSAVRSIVGGEPSIDVASLSAEVQSQVLPVRVAAMACLVFGAMALVLLGIGQFVLLAYTVVQRTSEIGLRLALGATRTEITRLVIGRNLRMTGIGGAIGVICALMLGTILRSLLYGVSATDPMALVIAIGVVGSTAALAAWLPARRATRIEPATALRQG